MKKIVTKNKGFTIIELLIASVIISTGLLTVVSMIVNAFSSTVPLSDNLTASYLTQEGFEIVRRIRDTNFNKRYTGENGNGEDYDWLANLIEDGDSATGGVDYESTELRQGKEDEKLYIDDDGLFGYDDGGDAEETTFEREIDLKRSCYEGYHDDDFEDDHCGSGSAEYILVRVEVRWDRRGETRSYQAETKLFNWY